MRILLTTAWYPNRKVAGDGVFIQKHARAVARLNDVAVLMVQTDVAVRGLHIEVEASENIASGREGALHEVLVYVPKTCFELPVITGLVRMFWLMAGYLKGYRYILHRYWDGHRPEACHVNVLTRAAGLPWLLKRIYGIPYIITEHWTRYARPDAYPQSSMQLRLGRWFVRDASYVCPVSLNLEQAMKHWGLDNKHYTRVGNVVDTDLFTLRTNPQSMVCRLVHVSWLRDPAKNVSGILRALSQLRIERQDWHLDIVGEGNDKEMLIALSHTLGLDSQVTFLPAMQGEALAQCMSAHDAMVMFSNFENQPVSILEALSCGLPVIATSIAAIPGMLAQKRGVVVEPRNEQQLLEVLRSFVALHASLTPEQRNDATLSESRHQYVVQHHSPEVIARQFDVLYRASMASRR